MSTRNLEKILNPRRVVVIGAANRGTDIGYTILRNLMSGGYAGAVYPLHPESEEVAGIPAYENLSDLPAEVDLAMICTPPDEVPRWVDECGKAGIRGIVILSSGFRETGAAGLKIEEKIKRIARRHDGMRIVGPNSMGVIVPSIGLNASYAGGMPKPGPLAFISQSGALCTSVLDWAAQQRIGFSCFVSIGNMLDVSFADVIDYCAGMGDTKSVMLYVESVPEARSFLSAARAYARTMPIVAYKAGRFPESARAASSHTGAMAVEDDIYDAAFRRAGIERVYDIDDLFDCAGLLTRRKLPCGGRLAIVTNAGGPGVMATDALIASGGTLAGLSAAALEDLGGMLPAAWSHGNPVDVLGDAGPERYVQAVRRVLEEREVDAVLAILTPQAMTDPEGTARALAELARGSRKLLLAAWMGGESMTGGIRILHEAGVPTYSNPEHAVHAFMHLVSHAANLRMLHETPRDVPVTFRLDPERRRKAAAAIFAKAKGHLGSADARALLEVYGIPVAKACPANTPAKAVACARKLGYPVALKILAPAVSHKSDVGGVELHIRDDSQVRDAFKRIMASVKAHRPDIVPKGVTVEPMVAMEHSLELIVGVKRDPTFGSVILVGAGGVAAEVLNDRALGLPPLNETLVRHMLESLRIWPLLQGFRGRPAVNLKLLVEILLRFSYLVADHPDIAEFDINPLLVSPSGVIALDARAAIIPGPSAGRRGRAYSHLALSPYPEHYVTRERLKDGGKVTLRPIKPEDEPMWLEMLRACSQESIRMRFFSLISDFTHEMAVRYCVNDYDRELALVAETDEGGRKRLVGVARLEADPDHTNAEYAVIVPDAYQGKGIGGLLTRRCMEIAKDWGVREVIAITLPDNHSMVSLFRRHKFRIQRDAGGDTITATRRL
jgi:acetyltransferase